MTASRPEQRQRVLLLTGVSGAGKTSALKALEDMGYEVVDNLPLTLLNRLLATPQDDRPGYLEVRLLAVGLDSRTRAFSAETLLEWMDQLQRRRDISVELVVLLCDEEELARRFSETRRRHPLAGDRPLSHGIALDREIMAPLKARADHLIDTTGLAERQFRSLLAERFGGPVKAGMGVSVMSFGFANGMPRDADLVFDVRFLRNPHYVEQLQPRTGRAPEVAAYIAQDPAFAPFLDHLRRMLDFLIPLYEREGKSYLTIAFGCTGGRHRSVFLAETVKRHLDELSYRVNMVHRDSNDREDMPGTQMSET